MRGVRFAPLEEAHLSEIMEIERASHGAPWSEQSFRNELAQVQSVFLVAMLEGKVAGYAGAWILADEAHVTTIAVHPDKRRQGLGRHLMEELLDRSKDAGAVCSTLEVRAGNMAALHLYEELGYVRAGVRKRYYPDNREDAVVMWLHDMPE